MNCRHCGSALEHTFVDLGFAPPSNAYLAPADTDKPEVYYPLRAKVCTTCWLVQTEDYARADTLFTADYAYFSSTSTTWLVHAKRYCEAMRERLKLGHTSFVMEVGSNDGYLLRNFVAAGIPCVGIEPTANTAEAAEKLDVPVVREFFGESLGARLAAAGKAADLIVCNNVYAHVPDINDFTRGLKCALKRGGTITLEFPHLLRLIEQTQFDTIYHEHFSYPSLYSAGRVMAGAGLRIVDVEELATHGGSLRLYVVHEDDRREASRAVRAVLDAEEKFGLRNIDTYGGFQARADALKNALLAFLIEQKRAGRKVVAYGAAAKGNTLLNYAGIRRDLVEYVCDGARSKQGKLLPGSHIAIEPPEKLRQTRPDIVLILPWNIADEIVEQHGYVREWGGRFAVAVPAVKVWS